MVVNVTVAKLSGRRVRVSLCRQGHQRIAVQEYNSEREAGQLLLDMGIPDDAVEFYFSKLFPCLETNQELALPETNIPEHELRWRGFGFAETG